jgi:hypothetical protein
VTILRALVPVGMFFRVAENGSTGRKPSAMIMRSQTQLNIDHGSSIVHESDFEVKLNHTRNS